MKLQPTTPEEAKDLVEKILIQGDHRYYSIEDEEILADLLKNNIILIEQREFPKIKVPSNEEIQRVYRVQKQEKYVAKELLKLQGFKEEQIFFERKFLNSIPDITAESSSKIILVECCSCRVSKILDYLTQDNTKIWIITQGEFPWETPLFEKMSWFIFSRGENWNKEYIEEIKRTSENKLKQIHNPLDKLLF